MDEEVWDAAEKVAVQANTDLTGLVREYLARVAQENTLPPRASEFASRQHLLGLLKDCSISLDGKPTRESFYTDRRFH